MIEQPVNAALNHALTSAKRLGDEEMAKKAHAKFQRIFGDMFSSIALVRSNLDPLIAILEDDAPLNVRSAKNVVDGVKAALPMIRAALSAVDPRGHEGAVEVEIKKQQQFLEQMSSFIKKNASLPKEQLGKLQLALKSAEFYIENLKVLASPDYADRIQHNVDRIMKFLSSVVADARTLALEFGARPKAASVQQLKKRIHQVSKRIVLLAYLQQQVLVTRKF